jgi:hypothetical protein
MYIKLCVYIICMYIETILSRRYTCICIPHTHTHTWHGFVLLFPSDDAYIDVAPKGVGPKVSGRYQKRSRAAEWIHDKGAGATVGEVGNLCITTY